MYLLRRISLWAAIISSTAYVVYAFTRYRAALQVCRDRLTTSSAVQLFHAHLCRGSLMRSQSVCHSGHQATGSPKTASFFVVSESGSAEALRLALSCPVAFVDRASFDENVRAVAVLLLKQNKQIRLATKGVRCAGLLERAAVLMNATAESYAERDVYLPQKQLVSGLLTSTVAETVMWARRGTFSSLLLSKPIADASSAACFVEAITLNSPSNVRCMVVVNMVEQLELLLNAAKEWITSFGYAREGFDNMVESLVFDIMLYVDVFSWVSWESYFLYGKEALEPNSFFYFTRLFLAVEELNNKVAKERLPVGVKFVVKGFWEGLGEQLSVFDTAPVALPTARCFIPARWFLRYPLLKLYKKCVLGLTYACHVALFNRLEAEKMVLVKDLIISSGSSASVVTSAENSFLTEVCVGSGLLCGHRLDRYVDSPFKPALYFALRATHAVSRRVFVCAGFGSSLPAAVVVCPPHLRLARGGDAHFDDEDDDTAVLATRAFAVGDAVVFRPERCGVLAELVDFYLLVTEEGTVAEIMRTYRGEGWNVWTPQLNVQ